MPAINKNFDGCDHYALLECVDQASAAEVYQHFRTVRHKTLTVSSQAPVMVCEVTISDYERSIIVLFNGDLLSGYGAFFRWCEERLHQVSLIRVGTLIGHTEVALLSECDPLDAELLESGLSMRNQSDYYLKCQDKLVKAFLKEVTLSNFSAVSLQRIVDMCCLGPDPQNKCEAVMQLFTRWSAPVGMSVDYNSMHWVDAIGRCHTVGEDHTPRTWKEGSCLLSRVLAHLVYLERVNPTPSSVARKYRGQGIQRLQLH